MIGEDAVNSTTAMLEKLMQIILEIIRMQRDSQRYNSREAAKLSCSSRLFNPSIRKCQTAKNKIWRDEKNRI